MSLAEILAGVHLDAMSFADAYDDRTEAEREQDELAAYLVEIEEEMELARIFGDPPIDFDGMDFDPFTGRYAMKGGR